MSYFPPAYHAFREGKTRSPARVTRDGKDFLYLGCLVERIEYDFPTHTGRAFLLPEHCPDGTSVRRYFQLLDPAVRRIETVSGGRGDTVYEISAEGWCCMTCADT
jgi:hypothetical protein